MYRRFKALHSNDASEDVCWFAASTVMNPCLPMSVVDKAIAEDASRARAEFLNVFREDIADFLPVDVIEAATDFGVMMRAPLASCSVRYIAYCDPAGGTGKDSFTLAIAHRDPKRMLVVDFVAERRPRFVPARRCRVFGHSADV